MMVLIGGLFVLPLLGAQLGIDLNIVWQLVQRSTNVIIDLILWLTGYVRPLSTRGGAYGIEKVL